MIRRGCLFLWILLVAFLVCNQAQAADQKFLIIHLDGVSAADFYYHYNQGNLPNVRKIFEPGVATTGLTLFPPGTEIIYPRILQGRDNSEGTPVAWEHYDREKRRVVHQPALVLDLYRSMPRTSRSQFLLAIPGLYHIAGSQLMNAPRLLREYDILQYFWYHTDLTGHYFGAEAHRRSLAWFDVYMGLLVNASLPEQTSIILYTDHGMTMGELKDFPLNQILSETAKEAFLFFHYPNLYLHDPHRRIEIAQILGTNPNIPWAFVRIDDNTVRGYHNDGFIDIDKQHNSFRIVAHGPCPLGYDEMGAVDQYLTQQEWLRLTIDWTYPGVPPNIYQFMLNPYAGDVVLVLNPYKIPDHFGSTKGHHISLMHTDTRVPILARGPAAQYLSPDEPVWLHELLTSHIPNFEFPHVPARDQHRLEPHSGPGISLMLSPAYRVRTGVSITKDDWIVWAEYDIQRTFLSRIWIGPTYGRQDLGWQARVEFSFSRLGWEWRYHSQLPNSYVLTWDLDDSLQLSFRPKHHVGIVLSF